MDVLVVGAGVAGPTLAHWLSRAGHRVTLVERAAELRRGGYLIDVWGAGLEVLDRMGLAGEVRRRGYVLEEVRAVDGRGRRIGAVRPAAVLGPDARYVSIARSDLAAAVCGSLDDRVDLVLGDTVATLDDTGDRVAVGFAGGGSGTYDLVVGADGLHSRVRDLTFGGAERWVRPLGVVVAAVETDDDGRGDELVALMHAGVGFQVARVALPDARTLLLATVREHDGRPVRDDAARRALVHERLSGAGEQAAAVLRALDDAAYVDSVSQVRMPSWSRGRVVLVGDAAACPSLLAGQGSALAMVEAYVLAAELGRTDDVAEALRRYDERLAAPVRGVQDRAVGSVGLFAPKGRRELLVRDLGFRAAAIPGVASVVVRRGLRDGITLPDA